MTCEQLVKKWSNRDHLSDNDAFQEYISDLWSLPMEDLYKLPVIIGVKNKDNQIVNSER